MDETPETTERTPSMKLSHQQKEQRIESGSKIPIHTLQSSLLTVEHDDDDDGLTVLSLSLLQRSPSQMTKVSEGLKLKDLEVEQQEESLQSKSDASAVMSINQKMNILGVMEKPIGTKVPNRRHMQYSRGKVGESLYQDTTQFHLTDPHMRQMPGTYISLHDKYLKKFFNKPGRRKQLIDQGLITEDGDVLCSQKEFNQYIDYLKYSKPKPGEFPFQNMRYQREDLKLFTLVEEKEEEILLIGGVSRTSGEEAETRQHPSNGPKNIKVLAFFKRKWKTVKLAFTRRRSSEISPVR